MKKNEIFIYSFYRFKTLKEIKSLKIKLNKFSDKKKILGTIIFADEGVNGTISGSKIDLDSYMQYLKKLLKIKKISIKISNNLFFPFYRLKIKLKREIVTIGDKTIKPDKISGEYIHPKDWDKIIENKDYLLIDTRNEYEVSIGSFKNALNPKTKSFKEFPLFINQSNIKKDKPIAMFCTGGIRCEKASSYLKKNGYQNVYQLDGGILNYLEYKKNKKNQTWNGECFVFDNRVSITKKLHKGSYDQCYGCRRPITEIDKKLKSYKKGVHCKYCIKNKSLEKIKSSQMRQNQINDAKSKGVTHTFKRIYLK